LIIYKEVDFFELTYPKIILPPLLNILFLIKNKRCYEMKRGMRAAKEGLIVSK